MKILITGANGFLGARLAKRLASEGHEVTALVMSESLDPYLSHPGIITVRANIREREKVAAAMQGIDQLYHLAAISTDWASDMRDFYRVNVEGTLGVMEIALAAGVKRIVVTSTAGMIGPPDPEKVEPVDEEHIRHVRFFTDYECSKIIMEERIQRMVRKGAPIVIVNPTRVFGPGPIERKNGYLILVRSYLHRKFAPYPGFKTQLGNLAFVNDVVEGHVLAMQNGVPGERYLLGGHNVRFQDLFDTLTKITGKKGRPVAIPIFVFKFVAWLNRWEDRLWGKAPVVTREWLRKSSFSWPISCEKAVRELGYQITPFEEALRLTVAHVDAEEAAGRGKAHVRGQNATN